MKHYLTAVLIVIVGINLQAGELEDNQKACSDGMAIACQNLGDLYYKGKKVMQDYVEAAKYYARACNGGYVGGCSALASMSEKGQGIVKNTGYIAVLYAKACEGNDFKGCYGSLMIYKRGLEGLRQKNYLKAKDFFSKAAKDGDPRALEIYNKLIAGKLYPLKKDSKYGFINAKGEWVIKPKFDDVGESVFKDHNLLRVKLNGKWGYINSKDEWINEPKLDENTSDTQKSKLNDEWEIVYTGGKWLIEPLLYGENENELTRVESNEKWGVKNAKGEWIIEPKFDSIKENDYGGDLTFDGGLFLVTHNGKKGIVNTKGKWVIRQYDDILYGQENTIVDINGWIKVKRKGKWGAIDTDGKWVFKPQFDDVESFTVYDQLIVKHKGKWGFIDTKGKWVIKPKYDDVYHFSENDATGFGRIIRNGKEGYLNEEDGLLLEPIIDRSSYGPRYEDILVLQKTGLLIVGDSDYDKRGVVDKKGNWVLKQKFDDVEILDDLIYVTFGDREGYTTLDGKYLTFTKEELHLEELKKAFNIGNSKDIRHHPFVCYREKSKNNMGEIIYQECIRSDVKCSSIKRMHFGEYLNDLKAHEAFKRCTEGKPNPGK